MNTTARVLALLVLGVAAFFAPGLAGGSSAVYSAAVLIAIFAVMSYGLDLVVSDLGEVSLAHTVFFAVGCYTTALLSTRVGAGGWTTLAASIAMALLFAAVLGLVTLRLREFVFSLVTYAIAVVAATVAQNWEFLGGSDGIRGIPVLELALPGFSLKAGNDRELWPIAFGLLVVTLYLVDRFRSSRLGSAAVMTHLNPRLAIVSGIDPQQVRLRVFLASAPITASAGWLYAYQRAYVSADVLDAYFLILMLTAVVLVGRRLLLGPVLATLLVLGQEKFLSLGGYADKIILGSVLIATLALFPKGLIGFVEPLRRLLRSGRGAASG
ncbi:branched-chain amino acid ABC transporter permease [Quisquiliibacterium transsilvanicum]|uniref:Branched-chain amino acid transport system permease protein n=1 Tax=Quisquiliibacterium transsilvanicum TaxID=1549638 RepID=A0A7W8HGL0_9BURK|nr:branched-chain amino acid ABC transporter permease [Quisquiliibacterium transsilvanicum]MBB5271712.1 branched-chain amino acid transport system permease protein [Quisquiliibacterium transsilvanicum]